jgi:hypothetical protein
MSTIKKTKVDAPEGAERRLADLEVQEVSIVDEGANLRRYLVVKKSGEVVEPESLSDALNIPEISLTKTANALLQELLKLCVEIRKVSDASIYLDEVLALSKFVGALADSHGGVADFCDELTDPLMKAVELLTSASISAEHALSIQDRLATASHALWMSVNGDELKEILKGENLAAIMNREIDSKSEDRFERAEWVRKLANSVDLTPSTINQILRAEIKCATKVQLEEFAEVLDISAQKLIDAAVKDGCRFELQQSSGLKSFSVDSVSTDDGIVIKVDGVAHRISYGEFEDAVVTIKAGSEGNMTTEKKEDQVGQETTSTEKIDKEKNEKPTAEATPTEAVEQSAAPVEGTEVQEPTTEESSGVDIAKMFQSVEAGFSKLDKRFEGVEQLAEKIEKLEKRMDEMGATPSGSEVEPDDVEPTEKSSETSIWKGLLK